MSDISDRAKLESILDYIDDIYKIVERHKNNRKDTFGFGRTVCCYDVFCSNRRTCK